MMSLPGRRWLAGALIAACAIHTVNAAPLDLKAGFEQADKEGRPVTVHVHLAKGWEVPAVLETTSQGNGKLTIGNLALRLLDRHDDGLVYRGDVLKLEPVLLSVPDSSHAPALVVSGIVARTGDKESDPVQEEPLVAIFQLDCKSGRFRRVYFTGNAEIEMETPKAPRIRCPEKR